VGRVIAKLNARAKSPTTGSLALLGDERLRNVFRNSSLETLIQPDEKDCALVCAGGLGYFLRALLVIVLHAHSHPPVTRRTGKTKNFGSTIFSGQVIDELPSGALIVESANLYGPFASALEGGWSFQKIDSDLGQSRLPHIYFFCCRQREIQDASFDKRPAIGDSDQGRVSGLHVGNTHD
jgi:hypothetical protein